MINIPIILTIAGSDSGCGAGIQCDIKTIQALNGFGVSVITGLTAQNTTGVDAIFPVPVDFIEKQFISIISDFDVSAFKTGMLTNTNVVNYISDMIQKYRLPNYVLDPVMVSTSGDKLTIDKTIDSIIRNLIPLSTIITPNIIEAELILDRKIETVYDMKESAKKLLELGCAAVLLKGGHKQQDSDLPNDEICDVLMVDDNMESIVFFKNKICTKNLHGTGCTLSAALATFLGLGFSIEQSFYKAEEYIEKAIITGSSWTIGKGNGPLQHKVD